MTLTLLEVVHLKSVVVFQPWLKGGQQMFENVGGCLTSTKLLTDLEQKSVKFQLFNY